MKTNLSSTISTIFFLILTTLLVGCKKDKDDKKDTISANFYVTDIGNGGVKLVLAEYKSGRNYKFDFGDGTTSSNLSSFNFDGSYTYYYKNDGSYNIKLSSSESDFSSTSNSATISDEKTNSVTIVNVPTSVKVKYLKLKDFPSTNPANGQPWDEDLSGPDIQFYYSNVGINYEYFNQTPYPNATTTILPLQLTIDTTTFSVNTNTILFACVDYDSPSSSDAISTVSFNVKENSRQGATYQPGKTGLYSTKIENTYIEVGLEWIP